MTRMAEEIVMRGMTRDEARAIRRSGATATAHRATKKSATPYTFRYAPPGKEFKLEVRFRRTQVERAEVAAALRAAAESLETG